MDLATDTPAGLCSADPQALRAAVVSRLCLLRSELQEAELQLLEYSVATRQLVHAAHDVGEAIAYLTNGRYVATLEDGSAVERAPLQRVMASPRRPAPADPAAARGARH
jgi:hypothetical protein